MIWIGIRNDCIVGDNRESSGEATALWVETQSNSFGRILILHMIFLLIHYRYIDYILLD